MTRALFFLSTICILMLAPVSAAPPEMPYLPQPNKTSSVTAPRSLASVVGENLYGLSFEDADTQSLLKLQAKEFMAIKTGRMDAKNREIKAKECLAQTDEAANPFCPEILRIAGSRSPASKHRAPRPRRPNLTGEIIAARMGPLSKAAEADIINALKRVRDFKQLSKVLREIETASSCPSAALLTAVGFKAEEHFPDENYVKLARELYRKSADCDNSDSAVKARYRGGLIDIWQGRCADAEKTLSVISDNDEVQDYRSRATYWRLYCARQAKDSKLQAQLREKLLRDHPLSLHSLFIDGDISDLAIINPREPDVLFRSVKSAGANVAIRAVEALLSYEEGEPSPLAMQSANDLLENAMNSVRVAEPQFQLYVGVLWHRIGDTIRKFQVLASVFREQPSYISRLTMEMLYPLTRFDVVNMHKTKVDPYLVISLIRQESAFNDRARSPAGAMGLMQLMPGTARRLESVTKRELFDPKTNIRLGVKYVSKLLQKYEGDAELALAAYNAGPDKVDQWRRRYPIENRLLFLDLIPFKETREYVASIARNYYWYLRLYNRAEAIKAENAMLSREPASDGTSAPAKRPPRGGFTFF